ncbi:MAG: HAD family phosphatase [Saccharospirillaceae bacterium]|nr:HAD family phosphatase [Pseudomonadales bacterium]NRB79349.1 HAD family phosphatase [Saccharospirillaceae bacterium]
MKQAVIFDCDGVLIDSERLMTNVLHQSLAKFDLSLSQTEIDERIVGQTTKVFQAFLTERFGQALSEKFYVEHNRSVSFAFANDLVLIDGIESLLKSIQLPKACASNSDTTSLANKLKIANLDHYFDSIVAAQQVARPKPFADVYLKAASELKIEPNKCWVIEDSPIGMQAGANANMQVIAFHHDQSVKKYGAQVVFNKMSDIEAFLKTQK